MAYEISWVVLVVYILAMLYIGYWSWKKTKTLEDYYIAGRQLGPWIIAFSFFGTYFSTAAFLGGGGAGFLFGFQWSAYLAFFHILFAILAWWLIAPRMRIYSEKLKALTIPDFFEFRYNSKLARLVASVIIIIFFEFYMISIYKGAGNLFQEMLGVSYLTGILITVIPVIIYTAMGGFRSVAVTDLIQGCIMFFGAILLFLLVMSYVGGWSEGIARLEEMKLLGKVPGTALTTLGGFGPPPILKAGMMVPFILSLTFAISIAQLSSPQLIIRFYAAKDERVISRGMILGPVLIGIFALTVFSIGPFAWLIIPELVPKDQLMTYLKDPDLVVPFLVVNLFPPVVNAIILTAIVAAAMSTINSLLLVLATSLGRDILQVVKPDLKEDTVVSITRVMSFVFAFIPLLLAINPPGIIVTIVGVSFSVITAAFLAPLVLGLYWKGGTGTAAWVSMVVATIVCVLWYIYYYRVYWIYPVVPGLLVSVPLFILLSLVTKKPPQEVVELLDKR